MKYEEAKVEYDQKSFKYQKARSKQADGKNGPIEPKFIFMCCQNEINAEGCGEFYHTTDNRIVLAERLEQQEKDLQTQEDLDLS